MSLPLIAGAITLIAVIAAYFLLNGPTDRKVLLKDQFQEFPLIEKTMLSHNSGIYRFKLPKENDLLGLPIGQHIQITANINGKDILRSYTPTSNDSVRGYFDLLIKDYPQGNISKHIAELKIGESIKVKGPKGFYEYAPNTSSHIVMVAGGTGITPMYQIINAIVDTPEDKTAVTLLYGNQTEADILLKAELDQIAKANPNIKIHYFLDRPSENWAGRSGYITPDVLKELLPEVTPSTGLLICGPPPMNNSVKKAAVELGFHKAKPVSKAGDQIFIF